MQKQYKTVQNNNNNKKNENKMQNEITRKKT